MTDELQIDDFFDESLGGAIDKSVMTVSLEKHFKEYISNEDRMAELNAELTVLKSCNNKIKMDTLPALLNDFGSEVWQDPVTKIRVELETVVNSALPKSQEKRNDIYDCLRPIGVEEILGEELNTIFIPGDRRSLVLRGFLGLSTEIDVIESEEDGLESELNKDQMEPLSDEELDAIRNARVICRVDNENFPVTEKLGCHGARFKSWLKKKIDNGDGQVIKDAGIWYGKQAKFVRPKT